jgi:alkylation response protein AidB-like acyl-CoA dehydrogenase
MSSADTPAADTPGPPHRIRDDAEALDVARHLAADFAREPALRDRERRLPWEEIERMTASDLGGITVPRAHGGAGVSFATMAEVFATLSAADPALGQIPQNQFDVIALLREIGTPDQQTRLFADILAGHRIGNAGPEKGGASMLNMKTRLTRTPDGLRLDGRRFYSTGALFAHWIPTQAMAEEDGTLVSTLVFVPRTAPGVTVTDDWDGLGQRLIGSGSVSLTMSASSRNG